MCFFERFSEFDAEKWKNLPRRFHTQPAAAYIIKQTNGYCKHPQKKSASNPPKSRKIRKLLPSQSFPFCRAGRPSLPPKISGLGKAHKTPFSRRAKQKTAGLPKRCAAGRSKCHDQRLALFQNCTASSGKSTAATLCTCSGRQRGDVDRRSDEDR